MAVVCSQVSLVAGPARDAQGGDEKLSHMAMSFMV